MSVIIDHCSVPCVYGLLPGKSYELYRRFFEAIQQAVGHGWSSERIMSDFESAAVRAATFVFPNAIQTGCLFHFGKCLFRRIQRLPNLATQYRNVEDVQRNLRCLQALAFVPLPFVYNYLCILMSIMEPTQELQELIMYFINTWIGPRQIIEHEEILEENAGGAADNWIRGQIEALNLGQSDAIFSLELWNVVDRVAGGLCRTNNSLEVWHLWWNNHLKGNRRLSSLIRKMIEEDEMWVVRVADYQVAPANGIRGPGASRRAENIRRDNNLQALLNDFDARDPLEYLRACSYHLHF